MRVMVLALLAALSFPAPMVEAQTTVTPPKAMLGFDIGDDYQLANYTRLSAYWRKLDEESDRVSLVEYGRTSEGRPMLHGHRHLAGQPQAAGPLQGHRAGAWRWPRG